MKKKNLLILLIALFLFIPSVKAASASIGISTSGKAVVGNTVTVTVSLSSSQALGSWEMLLNYDSSYLKLTSSTAEGGGTKMVGYVSNGSTKKTSYTFKFKTLKKGSASVSISNYSIYAYDESQMSASGASKSISIITQEELEASYSKDNSLKSLVVEGYEIEPGFNKDVTDYKLTVPADVTKVNVVATKNDSTATVTGGGEIALSEGSNNVSIVVTAQNGSTKTYNLVITVEDLNPIEVKVGKENLSIVKRADNLTAPNGFQPTTIKIDDVEIPALFNEDNGLTLVGLKDEEGNISLYIYDDKKNTYELYLELNFDGISFYPAAIPEIFKDYKKDTIEINKQKIECLRLNKKSNFVILYGTNLLTGKKGYYTYDIKNNTLQEYNKEHIDLLRKDIKDNYYVMIALGSISVLMFILLILVIVGNSKTKKLLIAKNKLLAGETLKTKKESQSKPKKNTNKKAT